MDQHSQQFIQALQSGNIETVRTIPKADLHNHFPLGGNRAFIKSKTSIDVQPFTGRMRSMDDMHGWVRAHLGTNFQTSEMRKFLIDAAFVQAKEDGITILEVRADYRRKGIARSLVQEALGALQKRNMVGDHTLEQEESVHVSPTNTTTPVYANISSRNTPSKSLHESLGFTLIATGAKYSYGDFRGHMEQYQLDVKDADI